MTNWNLLVNTAVVLSCLSISLVSTQSVDNGISMESVLNPHLNSSRSRYDSAQNKSANISDSRIDGLRLETQQQVATDDTSIHKIAFSPSFQKEPSVNLDASQPNANSRIHRAFNETTELAMQESAPKPTPKSKTTTIKPDDMIERGLLYHCKLNIGESTAVPAQKVSSNILEPGNSTKEALLFLTDINSSNIEAHSLPMPDHGNNVSETVPIISMNEQQNNSINLEKKSSTSQWRKLPDVTNVFFSSSRNGIISNDTRNHAAKNEETKKLYKHEPEEVIRNNLNHQQQFTSLKNRKQPEVTRTFAGTETNLFSGMNKKKFSRLGSFDQRNSLVAHKTNTNQINVYENINTTHFPELDKALKAWGCAMEIHIYSLGALFIALALGSLITIVKLSFYPHLLSKPYLVSLSLFVFLMAVTRSLYLLLDPYNLRGSLPVLFGYALFSLPVPSITSAFAILFLSLLRATHVELLKPWFQSGSTLAYIIISHFGFNFAVDIITGLTNTARFLLTISILLFILWGITLSVSYWFIFSTLYRSAQRLHIEALRQTVNKLQIEGGIMPRRLPQPTTCRAVRITLLISLLSATLSALQLYGGVWVYDILAVFGGTQFSRLRPWAWFGFQLLSRLLELLIGVLMLYVASQPVRRHETGGGWHHLTRALRVVRGAGAALRPKRVPETDYYPVVCSHNQALQAACEEGRLFYDDHLTVNTIRLLPAVHRQILRRSMISDSSRTSQSSRPPSFLTQNSSQWPPLPPLSSPPLPPPPPPDAHLSSHWSLNQQTVRSNGTQTSDEYTDVYSGNWYRRAVAPDAAVPVTPPPSESRSVLSCAACARRVSTPNVLDTEDALSSAQSSHHCLDAATGACRCTSSCSSESAAHSFDMQLYCRERHVCKQKTTKQHSNTTEPAKDLSVSNGNKNHSWSVDAEESWSQNMNSSDMTSACLGLELQSLNEGADQSDDITPDSAVVTDYDTTQYDMPSPELSNASARQKPHTSQRIFTRNEKQVGFQSLSNILDRCNVHVGSRNFLERFYNSTFSLKNLRGRYHTLSVSCDWSEECGSAVMIDRATQTDDPPPSRVASELHLTECQLPTMIRLSRSFDSCL